MPHTTGGSYRSRPGHMNPRRKAAFRKAAAGSSYGRMRARKASFKRSPSPSASAFTRASANARFKRTSARPGTRSAYAKRFGAK